MKNVAKIYFQFFNWNTYMPLQLVYFYSERMNKSDQKWSKVDQLIKSDKEYL